MVDWLNSGIPAAVEVSGPRFLATMIQLILFASGAFAGGLFFGRFWLTRIIQNKDTELASQARQYDAQSEWLSFREDQIKQLQDRVQNAPSLEEAQKAAEELKEEDGVPYITKFSKGGAIDRVGNVVSNNVLRSVINSIRVNEALTYSQIANEIGIPTTTLETFMKKGAIDLRSSSRIADYAAKKRLI